MAAAAAIDVDDEWAAAEAAWEAAEAEAEAAAEAAAEERKEARPAKRRRRPASAGAPRQAQAPRARQAQAPRARQAQAQAPRSHVPLDEELTDARGAELKGDHALRPLWVCPDGRIFLEQFNQYYQKACDFLSVVAEPVCRPHLIHEYRLTTHSLYSAVAVGLSTEHIIDHLAKLSKVRLVESLVEWVRAQTLSFGKARLVLRENCHWVECSSDEVMQELLSDPAIVAARDTAAETAGGNGGAGGGAGGGAAGASGDALLGEGAVSDDALERMMQDWEAADPSDQQQQPIDLQAGAESMSAQMRTASGSGSGSGGSGAAAAAASSGSGSGSSAAAAAGAASGLDPPTSTDEMYLEKLADGGVTELGEIVAPWEAGAAQSAGVAVFKFALQSGQAETVKQRCIERQTPLLEEYDFRRDSRNPKLSIEKKEFVELRNYQVNCLAQMFSTGRARSGVIVLPCGAGKTITGLMAAVTIKKSTLVLCVNTLSVEQWREHFASNTTVEMKDIHVLTSDKRPAHNFLAPPSAGQAARGCVVITTYPMVTYSGKRNEVSDRAMRAIRSTEWGLLILDEVHQVPARTFRSVLSACDAHCKLGLTATLVREDERISDLHFLIGPKLYEANWQDLASQGHLARVQCVEVWTHMTPEFYREYLKATGMAEGSEYSQPKRRQLLFTMNPNKIRACKYLIDFHERKYDKILVFCDNLYCLKRYAQVMNRPYICGSVKQSDRVRMLEQFLTSDESNCLFISRVGDTAIDLPAATVIIQIACADGSRRQEAQRLGRILRPKGGAAESKEPNAFFYSLVSRDTDEVKYAAKRQSFLVDQGYAFKVNDAAKSLASAEGLPYANRQAQLQLLAEVLACGEVEELEEEEVVQLGARNGVAAPAALAATRRTGGSLSELSGGAGLLYQEFAPSDRGAVRQGLQRHVPGMPAAANDSDSDSQ